MEKRRSIDVTGATDKHQQEQFHSHRGIFWIRGGASASVNSTKASTFLLPASFSSYPGIHAVGIDPSMDTPGS